MRSQGEHGSMAAQPDGTMQIRQDAIPPMPDAFKQVIEEMK